jgi:hypothetical protein
MTAPSFARRQRLAAAAALLALLVLGSTGPRGADAVGVSSVLDGIKKLCPPCGPAVAFLEGYIKYVELTAPMVNAMSERIGKRAKELERAGHSAICAGAHAADEAGMLSAPVQQVVRLRGGCPLCDGRDL